MMRSGTKILSVLLAWMLFTGAALSVAVDTPLENPEKEALARSIMKDIRCVVCQNQSIEDSNAELAQDLRKLIREQVEAGQSPDAIRNYLVDRYGEWVLLKPPVNQTTYFLWASPFFVLLILAAALVARRRAHPKTEPLSAEEEARLADILRNEP